MNQNHAQRAFTPSKTTALRAVVFLLVLLALWGYFRGFGGQLRRVGEGIQQLAPQAEERNRLVRELANEPDSSPPK